MRRSFISASGSRLAALPRAVRPSLGSESPKGAVVLTQGPRIRLTGRGDRLRLRQRGEWQQDPLQDVRECCRASMAVEKALGEAVRAALASGASWQEVGRVLGVAEAAQSKHDVIEAFAETKREVWRRFWGQS
jgi:hypothetical protein